MNQPDENPKRTQAFVQIRIMNALSDAAVMAANWEFPLENFLACAENLYLGFSEILRDQEPGLVTPQPERNQVWFWVEAKIAVLLEFCSAGCWYGQGGGKLIVLPEADFTNGKVKFVGYKAPRG